MFYKPPQPLLSERQKNRQKNFVKFRSKIYQNTNSPAEEEKTTRSIF